MKTVFFNCLLASALFSIVASVLAIMRRQRSRRRVIREVRSQFSGCIEMGRIMRKEYKRYVRNRRYKR